MLKPYQFHKVSLTLNLDRIITTTQQSTHFPRVFSQSVSLAPSCRWQGGVAEYLHSLHLLGPPHCAALCPSALFSPVLFALTVILPSVKAIENLGGVWTWNVACIWGFGRVFCTLKLGKGTVWIQSPYLLLPPKKGFLWLRFRGGWKGKL